MFLGKADVYCTECRLLTPRSRRREIVDEDPTLRILTPGLAQLKNCCYINAAIQALASVDSFVMFCKEVCYFRKPTESSTLENQFIRELAELISKLRSMSYQVFDPSNFFILLKLMMQGFEIQERQDCHAFMSMLFDRLRSSLRSCGEVDIIEQCFVGHTTETYKCRSCPWTSSLRTPFEIFEVPMISSKAAVRIRQDMNIYMNEEDVINVSQTNSIWGRLKGYPSFSMFVRERSDITLLDCLHSLFQPKLIDYR